MGRDAGAGNKRQFKGGWHDGGGGAGFRRGY